MSDTEFNGTINDPDGLSSPDSVIDEPLNSEESITSPINQVGDSSDTDIIADQDTDQPMGNSGFTQISTTDAATLSTRTNTVTPELEANRLKYSEKEAEFKKKIKERNFFEAFAGVVMDLVRLEVITVVEDQVTPYQSLDEIEGLPGQRMVTIVNLLDGDIKNIIGSRFVEDAAYTQLKDFHAEQVNKSHAILKGNIDCLSTAIKSLLDIKKQQDEIQPLLNVDESLTP